MLTFFYKKKYIVRHKILKALQDYLDKVTGTSTLDQPFYYEEIVLNVKQISEATNIPEKDVLPELEILHDRKQIHLGDDPHNLAYFITKQGTVAYYDKTYIDDGKKSLLTVIKDGIAIITTLGLFSIAVFTFFKNISKTESNSSEIEILKNKIDSLEKKIEKK